MINLDDFEIFNARKKSLKELSKDDSDPNNVTYMTCCELSSVDFDAVKDNYQRKLGLFGDRACSVDAVIQISDSVIFLEFKNGNMKNEKSKVKQKLRDSLLIFSDLTGMMITDTRKMPNLSWCIMNRKMRFPNKNRREFKNPSRD